MIFATKDSLRQAVEAASGGQCTVMYTNKGRPVFMRRIPKFRVETLHPALGTGVHPAFIVGDREIPEFWVSMYPVTLVDGELVSVPYQVPSSFTLSSAVAAARATGPGFHVITNAEWAAIALYTIHARGNDDDPTSGPDSYGRDRFNPKLFGQRLDGRTPGDTSASSYVYPGSGPLTWRHDGTPFGIDLMHVLMAPGYLVTGLLLRNGEINIIPNNDAALPTVVLTPTGTAWQAILPDGTLVAPGTSGTLKFDLPPVASYQGALGSRGAVTLSTSWQAPPFDLEASLDFTECAFKDMAKNPGTLQVPSVLHTLLLYPHVPVSLGMASVRPYGTRLPSRGWQGLASIYMRVSTSNSAHTTYTYLAYVA